MYSQTTSYPVIDLVRTGSCIEQQRRQAGLTVKDVQNYFGFEYPQAIYKWQHGECLPTVDNLLALARLLQVPMEDLLVYEDREVSFLFVVSGVIKYIWIFWYTALNYRFNDGQSRFWYYTTVDLE